MDLRASALLGEIDEDPLLDEASVKREDDVEAGGRTHCGGRYNRFQCVTLTVVVVTVVMSVFGILGKTVIGPHMAQSEMDGSSVR